MLVFYHPSCLSVVNRLKRRLKNKKKAFNLGTINDYQKNDKDNVVSKNENER